MLNANMEDFVTLKNSSGTSDVHYPTFCQYVPNEYKSVAQKELNETDENKAKGIKHLRDFLKKENIHGVEDNTLVVVLRSCKYNLKKSEVKLKKFLTVRSTIFRKIAEMEIKAIERTITEECAFGFLPYRDREGRAFMYTTPKVSKDINMEESLTIATWAIIYLLEEYPMFSITGIVYLGDCKCESLAAYYPIIRPYIKFVSTWIDMPLRVASIEVTNGSKFMKLFSYILIPFLSHKIRKRLYFHASDFAELRQKFNPDLLPEDFGGNQAPLNSSTIDSLKSQLLLYAKEIQGKYKM